MRLPAGSVLATCISTGPASDTGAGLVGLIVAPPHSIHGLKVSWPGATVYVADVDGSLGSEMSGNVSIAVPAKSATNL